MLTTGLKIERTDTKSVETIPLRRVLLWFLYSQEGDFIAGLKIERTQNQLKLSLYIRKCYVTLFMYRRRILWTLHIAVVDY